MSPGCRPRASRTRREVQIALIRQSGHRDLDRTIHPRDERQLDRHGGDLQAAEGEDGRARARLQKRAQPDTRLGDGVAEVARLYEVVEPRLVHRLVERARVREDLPCGAEQDVERGQHVRLAGAVLTIEHVERTQVPQPDRTQAAKPLGPERADAHPTPPLTSAAQSTRPPGSPVAEVLGRPSPVTPGA
jgi:hypothetical protein